jgi:DNA-binding CsgD family transcriptional regulator
MRTIVLSLLSTLIPNTCASILLSDHTDSSNLLCDPICFPASFTKMENDYLAIENLDYSRWMLFNSKAMIVRDTDLLPEEERIKTTRYQRCYLPYNLHYSVDMSIVDNNQLLGTLSLYRTKEMGDFTDSELFKLNVIGEHLNARFYREFTKEDSGEVSDDILLQLINEYGLTSREAEVLQMVFCDLTNDEIASQLYISPNTLKKHLQNLYRKLGASSRWELMSLKLRQPFGKQKKTQHEQTTKKQSSTLNREEPRV